MMANALHKAAQVGDEAFFSSYTGDIDELDENGDTALLIAISRGHTRAIRALIEAKANVNCKAKGYGSTPLIMAASWPT